MEARVNCIHARNLRPEKIASHPSFKEHIDNCDECQLRLKTIQNESELLDNALLNYSVSFDTRRELDAEVNNIVKIYLEEQSKQGILQRRSLFLSQLKINMLSFVKGFFSPVSLFFLIVGVALYLI